jgi:hypothetical protein
MRLVICFVLALAINPSVSIDTAFAAGRPLPLLDLEDAARYLFGAARDSQWRPAAGQLETLQNAFMDLPKDSGPNDVLADIRARVRELAETVPQRDRVKTMQASNDITELCISLDATDVPAQVFHLAYLGRQLEVGVAARQQGTIRRATADIKQTWSELEPQLIQRRRLSVIRRMTDIVASLDGATRLSDVSRLARAELDTVNRLENAWT